MNARGMHVSHTHIRLLSDSSVSGEVQNLVGIHPSANTVKSEDIEGAIRTGFYFVIQATDGSEQEIER